MARKARFQVFRDDAGEWRWRLRAANGRIVSTSGESFLTWWGARRAARTAKQTMASADVEAGS